MYFYTPIHLIGSLLLAAKVTQVKHLIGTEKWKHKIPHNKNIQNSRYH